MGQQLCLPKSKVSESGLEYDRSAGPGWSVPPISRPDHNQQPAPGPVRAWTVVVDHQPTGFARRFSTDLEPKAQGHSLSSLLLAKVQKRSITFSLRTAETLDFWEAIDLPSVSKRHGFFLAVGLQSRRRSRPSWPSSGMRFAPCVVQKWPDQHSQVAVVRVHCALRSCCLESGLPPPRPPC